MKAGHKQPQKASDLHPLPTDFAFGFKSCSVGTHTQAKPRSTHLHQPPPEHRLPGGGWDRLVKGSNWKERQSFSSSLCKENFHIVGKIIPTESKAEASVKHQISPKSERLQASKVYSKPTPGQANASRVQRWGHHRRLEGSQIDVVTDPNPS